MNIAIALCAAIIGLASVYWLSPDNPIEEAAEAVIKVETGETIDLSPKE